MWRSQPSSWHGRHGSGFCTSQTLPRFWMAALACHGAIEAAGGPRPPQPRIGRPEQRHRRAAARRREVRRRGVRSDEQPRLLQQRDVLRPGELMDRDLALPDRVEMLALGGIGPADCRDGQSALRQCFGERAPALRRPLLVAEHRRRMDHRNVVAGRERQRRRRRADHLRHARDAERVGEPQHLLDAMHGRVGNRVSVKRAGLDRAAERGSVGIDQADVPAAREPRKQCRAVAGLGRNRQVISLEQLADQHQRVHGAAPRRQDDHAVDVRIAFDDAGGAGEHQNVDRRIGPRAPHAADQRRGQQHVAEPAQRDDQDARLGGKR